MAGAAGAKWVPLAEVARPHGVRGELRLKVYNTDSDLLLHRHSVLVREAGGAEREVRVASARAANGAILMQLEGIGDRDAADLLRGAKVCVRRDAFPPLEPGEFYACDIVGARVMGADGVVGTVEDLVSYPTADALVVQLATPAGRVEVPLIAAYVERVDVEAGLVVLAPDAPELVFT